MRVNRQLGSEAKTYLYTHNTFIVLTHHHRGFVPNYMDGIHVVSQVRAAVASFRNHAMSLHFEWPGTWYEGGRTPTLPIESDVALILLEALPEICLRLRTFYHVHPGVQMVIFSNSPSHGLRWRSSEGFTGTRTLIQLRRTPYTPRQEEDAQRHQQHQRRLLHEFVHSSHGLISGAQRVTITGDISTSTSAAYEEIMTPRIVWAEAVGYDLVDLIETMKARYDKIADMYFHEWGVAWRVATLLLDLARDALDSFGIQLCGRTPGQAVPIPPWEQRIYILSFECILTSLTLAVRHNDYSLGPSAVHELHDRHRLRDLVQHLPTVLYTRILQFRALVELFFPNITTFANILDRHESAKASLELGLELMPEDDALTRDLAIVNAFISSQVRTTAHHCMRHDR